MKKSRSFYRAKAALEEAPNTWLGTERVFMPALAWDEIPATFEGDRYVRDFRGRRFRKINVLAAARALECAVLFESGKETILWTPYLKDLEVFHNWAWWCGLRNVRCDPATGIAVGEGRTLRYHPLTPPWRVKAMESQ